MLLYLYIIELKLYSTLSITQLGEFNILNLNKNIFHSFPN